MTTHCYCCPDPSIVSAPKSLPLETNPNQNENSVPTFIEEKYLDLKQPERILNLIEHFNISY